MNSHTRRPITMIASIALSMGMVYCGSEAVPEGADESTTPATETDNVAEPATGEARAALQVCRWFGTAPFCGGECPAGWTEVKRSTCSPFGGPGECGQLCVTGSKAYCCHDEP